MGKIRNTTAGDILITTDAGGFKFPAGGEGVDLAPERVEEVQKAGAVYFTAGELVTDEPKGKAKAEKADEADKAEADEPNGKKK